MGENIKSKNSGNSKSLKCSICIANYNGEKLIGQCIDSIIKQEKFQGTLEIIVHDDASTDNSIRLIKEQYPQIQLIISKQNVGFCISNNRMVAVAKGEFILLLNNDAILHTDALRTLHDAFEVNGDGIYGLPQYDASTGELIDIGSIFDPFLNPIPNKNSERSDVGMVIGACLFLPRHLWDALGGFPEWFGSLAEDMYLCCYARLRGLPVKVVASSKFSHWVGKSIGGGKVIQNRLSTTLTRRSISERNKTFVMLICYPKMLVWFVIPFHFLLLIIEGLLLTVIKKDKRIWLQIYWFCLREVWNKRSLWVEQRRVVQNARCCNIFTFLSIFTFIPHKLRMLFIYGIPNLR